MSSFLSDNIKSLVHIRKRLHRDNMLGLCLGAGVSANFSIPSWYGLIRRIAKHPKIDGEGLLNVSESLTSQSQFLFHRYKQNLIDAGRATGDEIIDARQAAIGWLHIVHECLYRGAKVEDEELRQHPYLLDLIPLIKQSAMTVNYNFDDSVERLLYSHYAKTIETSDDRGFEVVWQPSTQFRRQKGVIYHPNGFLPYRTADGLSDQIIFMEQEFADQLIDVGTGHYSCLLNHFSKHTILFIGLSLNDTTLKHLLRVAARINPGHFHYHIHWCQNGKPPADEQSAIREANFEVYNLVTLFLTTDEIKNLSRLILAEPESFDSARDCEPKGVNTDYRYYVTGTVGAGKTTAVEQIRSLDCFDEWVDRKHPLLHKPHEELLDDERRDVDQWINQQFRKKNRRVSQMSQSIALIDRCPVDPLYFAKNEAAVRSRALELLEWMVPARGPIKTIAPGHLVVLICDVVVLRTRLASRDKQYSDSHLLSQQDTVLDFWKGYPQAVIIDTTNMTTAQVAKRILKLILFDEYNEIEFQDVCKSKTT
jgi:SIR2-like domain